MTDDALWVSYANTVVDITPPGEPVLRIHPAPTGKVGTWPLRFTPPVFVITAWDPGLDRLEVVINRERQRALEADLRQLTADLWPAVGFDPDSKHYEEGVAVSGLHEEDAIRLGSRYGQNAIFAWTPTTWMILSCLDARHHESGWIVEPIPGEAASL